MTDETEANETKCNCPEATQDEIEMDEFNLVAGTDVPESVEPQYIRLDSCGYIRHSHTVVTNWSMKNVPQLLSLLDHSLRAS